MTDVDALVERLRAAAKLGLRSKRIASDAADALVALKEERDQLARFMGQKGMEDWDAMKAENERLSEALQDALKTIAALRDQRDVDALAATEEVSHD